MPSKTPSAQAQADMDAAFSILAQDGGSVHAKALEKLIGFGDGETPTRRGDRLYLAMKNDSRFAKKQDRIASYALSPWGKRKAKQLAAA